MVWSGISAGPYSHTALRLFDGQSVSWRRQVCVCWSCSAICRWWRQQPIIWQRKSVDRTYKRFQPMLEVDDRRPIKTHDTRTRNRRRKWSWFMAPVSGTCVMGLMSGSRGWLSGREWAPWRSKVRRPRRWRGTTKRRPLTGRTQVLPWCHARDWQSASILPGTVDLGPSW